MINNHKKTLIIISLIFISLILIISIIFINDNNKIIYPNKDPAITNIYIDPGTGETVYETPNVSVEKYNSSTDLTILGLSKLLTVGVTNMQLSKLKASLIDFSESKKDTPITEISITTDTININLNNVSGEITLSFEIKINRDYILNAQAKYYGINDIVLHIYDYNNINQIYTSI